MKKFLKTLLVVFIISLAFAAIMSAAGRKTRLESLVSVYADAAGDFYYLGFRGERDYYYKLNKDGRIITAVRLPKYLDGRFYRYKALSSDDNGNVYIVVYEKDNKQNIISKYIQVFDANGKKVKRIFEYDAAEEQPITKSETMYGLQFLNGKISVFEMGDEKRLIRYEYDCETAKTLETEYVFDEATPIREALYTNEGDVYYITQNGGLFRLRPSGRNERLDIRRKDSEKIVPFNMSVNGGQIYFTDVYNFTFMKYDLIDKKAEAVYEMTDEAGMGNRFCDIRKVLWINGMLIANSPVFQQDDSFIICLNDSPFNIEYKYYDLNSMLLNTARWFFISFILLALILTLLYLLVRLRSLFVKQITILAVIMGIPIVFITTSFMRAISSQIDDETRLQLYRLSAVTALSIDGHELRSMSFPEDFNNEYRAAMDKKINIGSENFEELYYTLFFIEDNEAFFAYGFDEVSGMRDSYNSGSDNGFSLTGSSYGPQIIEIIDPYGTWIISRAFILDEGVPVGVLEIGSNNDVIDEMMWELLVQNIKSAVLLQLFGILIFCIVLNRLLKGLRTLKDGLRLVEGGNFNVRLSIRSGDEIEDIADDFNKMASKTEKFADTVTNLNKGYQKFVPGHLFTILGKDNIFEVSLGDYVNKNVNLMSVSIKDFYAVSKKISEEETFEMVNSVLRISTGIIKKKGGIIESFTAYGLKAMFMDEVGYAIDSAIKIIEKTESCNKDTGKEIRLNITVQNGDIMIGITGDDSRMAQTSISQTVNNIPVLERIAENYNINLLVTETALEKLERKEKYNYCCIGRIKDDTENRFIKIYDFIDAYGLAKRSRRLATREAFEAGLDFYMDGNFSEARKKFVDVLKVDGSYEMAKLYLFLCDRKNSSVDWSGRCLV